MHEPEGLEVSLSDMLKAFDLAHAHTAKGRNAKDFLENRWQVTLGIIDRAVMESDRGMKLLAMTTKPSDPGGSITIWPCGG